MFLRLLARYGGGVFKSSCWYLFPKRVVDMDEETAFLRIVNKRVQQNINNNQVNFKHVNINQLKPYSFHFLRLRNFVPVIVHRSAPYYGSPYVSPLSPPKKNCIWRTKNSLWTSGRIADPFADLLLYITYAHKITSALDFIPATIKQESLANVKVSARYIL